MTNDSQLEMQVGVAFSMKIQVKANEQYFSVVLFIIPYFVLYKVTRTFEFVNEILKFYYSNESHWVVLSSQSLLVEGTG